MPNAFDQFDAPAAQQTAAAGGNAFDQFDAPSPTTTSPPATEQPSLLSRAGNAWLNFGPASVFEPAAQLASSMVATPVAGLAGLGAAGTRALGWTDAQPANVTNAVSDAMTYQPKTAGGQVGASIVNYPFRKLAEAADKTGAAFGAAVPALPGKAAQSAPISYSPGSGGWPFAGRVENPEVAASMNTAVQAIPAIFTRGRAKGAAIGAEVPKPVPTPREALMTRAKEKGLKFTPEQAGEKVGGLVQGLAGSAKLERSISLKNAPRVNELAGEDVGLKGSKAITEGDITRLKVEANKPYNAIAKTGVRKTSAEYKQEIANIGDRTGGESFKGDVPRDIKNLKRFYGKIDQFSAQDAVNKIRQLRSEASKNIKAVNAPEQNAKGYVQKAIAEALDNELTRHVESLGKPELAANYKAARVQLAKLHTLEDALEGSNVSAKSLHRALERGAPLDGNMRLIAEAYGDFDRSFQDVGKIRDSNPFSVLDLGAGVVGAASSLPLAAAVLARPAARGILASDRYQKRNLASGAEKPKTNGASKEALVKAAAADKQAAGGRR